MTPFHLSGRTVLLIGSVTDVAASVAAAMRQAGASIIVVQGPGSSADAHRTWAKVVETDLDDPVQLGGALAALTFGSVVISPGWFEHKPFMDQEPDDIDEALRVNFERSTYAIQAVSRRLLEQGQGGSVILLSSVVSQMPFVHTSLAGVSLAAAEVIARMAAVELGPQGIRVNVVAAGWLEDERSRPLVGDSGQLRVATDIPLGHVGPRSSIADACCFLSSPQSEYVTGAVLTVDGGYLLTKSEAGSPYAHDN